jgi:hypothetical protein
MRNGKKFEDRPKKIERLEIYSGMHKVFPAGLGYIAGIKRRRLASEREPEEPATDHPTYRRSPSSSFQVQQMIGRGDAAGAGPSLDSPGTDSTIPQSPTPHAGPSSSNIASSATGTCTIFDVLHNGAQPSQLPMHHDNVMDELRKVTKENSDDPYDALFPAGSPFFSVENSKRVRDDDKKFLKQLTRFLDEKNPRQTLAEAMSDFQTFIHIKKKFLAANRAVTYYNSFLNRLTLRCFYLPAVELVKVCCESGKVNARATVIRLGAAVQFEELLLCGNTSMAVLLAEKKKELFESYGAKIVGNRGDLYIRATLQDLREYFQQPPAEHEQSSAAVTNTPG